MIKQPIFINSKITGGHYALKTDKSDKPFENPMNYYTKLQLREDDVVADLGAYVGEYSLYASPRVKRVLSYEPTPYTFEILKTNKKENMELYNVAIVGNDARYVELFISRGIGVTNSIAKTINKSGMIMVPTMRYEIAVQDVTVVKIDVEGAEYLYNIIQPQLRGIILEFHPIAKKPWREWADKIMNDIENSGYKLVVKPEFKCGWDLTGCWEK